MQKTINYSTKLDGRGKFAYDNIPKNCHNLLDAGCSEGYFTIHFSRKSKNTFGVDFSEKAINIAKSNYPNITFQACDLGSIPLESNTLDCIICTDVIEHVEDEIVVFNEFERLLRIGGVMVISTPHKGLFEFLDPFNTQYFFRKYAYPLYKLAYRYFRKQEPKKNELTYTDYHRHYSLNDFKSMLQKSNFGSNYKIKEVKRTGFLLDPISYALVHYCEIIFKGKVPLFIKLLANILHLEFYVPFGIFAYNIALVIEKKQP